MGGKPNYTIDRSPIADLKAIKNATELEGFRQCHIRDGAALARYFAWLEEELVGVREDLTESQAADQLEKYRSELAMFKGLSFPTISSTGPNGGQYLQRNIPFLHSSDLGLQRLYITRPTQRIVL